MNIDEWAKSYIRIHNEKSSEDESHPDFGAAYEFLDVLVGEKAENCWNGILAVIKCEPSDYVLGRLAAGPIEDLIHYSGEQYIEKIEEQARVNPVFRKTLFGVWEAGSNEDVWKRVLKARGENV